MWRPRERRVMTRPSLAVRVVLGGIVGPGFVTPATAATLVFAGLDTSLAILGGVVLGIVVFVLVVTRTKQVR